MKRPESKRLIIAAAALIALLVFAGLLCAYLIRQHRISQVGRVIGIDVSAYQGDIDWKTIKKQGVVFAFIKATEGSDYTDKRFEDNWNGAKAAGIRRGAYMFYNFDEDGDKQAEYFIQTVPKERHALPPVIDVELSDGQNPPKKQDVIKNVQKVYDALKKHYKSDPILYTNGHTYETYFADSFKDAPFWICDLSSEWPELAGHDWTFWQYTWRGVLNGTDGSTVFTDMNLYNGTLADFYKTYK